jgi:hypothetical protein
VSLEGFSGHAYDLQNNAASCTIIMKSLTPGARPHAPEMSPEARWEGAVAGSYNRDQIRAALAETDPAYSFYLDLETGHVVKVPDTEATPEAEALRNSVMEGYGDRFRYIPGGKPAPSDADVQGWLDAEGI